MRRRLLVQGAIASGFLLIVFAVLSTVLLVKDRDRLRVSLEARAEAISGTVANVLHADSSHTTSTTVLQALTESMINLDDLLWVEVFDGDISVIAHSIPDRVGQPPLPHHHDYVRRVLEGEAAIVEWDDDNDRLNYFVAIDLLDARGALDRHAIEVVHDTKPLFDLLIADIRRYAVMALFATLIYIGALAVSMRQLNAAEAELRRAREQLARLGEVIERSRHEIYIFDIDTLKFLKVNAGARKNLGYEMAELEQMTPVDLEPLSATGFEELVAPLRSGDIDLRKFETTHRRRDGTTYPVHVDLGISHTGERDVFVGMIIDTTETRKMQDDLRRAQRMDALGQLSAEIAHDFNNILAAIQGSVDLMRLGASDTKEELGRIEKAIDLAMALTKRLLAFGRRTPHAPVALDLRGELDSLVPVLQRLIRSDVDVETDTGAQALMVKLDPGNFEQVVTNLAINARDAMPQGGRLYIRLGAEQVDGEDYAVIEVRDTGVGMDEETRDRAFEPFFTTKEARRGTGLGLSTVYGIVQQAGGRTEVKSRPGEGTTITVYLPIMSPKPSAT